MLLDFSKYEYPEKPCNPQTEFDKEVLDFLHLWRTKDHFTVQTSGSTGIPKAITHSKTAMQNSAKLTGEFFNFQKEETALLCLPMNKISGIMMLVRAIICQLKLYTLPPKLKLDLFELPIIDFAPLLPAQAMQNFEQLQKIKTILLGGASLPRTLSQKIQKHPSHFFHSYGMTETISHIALCDLQQEQNHYRVLPNIGITVNEENCLQINAPKLGVKKLQTNDIVQLTSKNSFHFLGRTDNVINSGGLKILAEDIEKQLTPYIEQNFYIAGTPDEKLGEKVTLFIEGKTWHAEDLAVLKNHFQEITPKQARPKSVIFQEKFAYTTTGKIMKTPKLGSDNSH